MGSIWLIVLIGSIVLVLLGLLIAAGRSWGRYSAQSRAIHERPAELSTSNLEAMHRRHRELSRKTGFTEIINRERIDP